MKQLIFSHIPETWVASDFPWTYVITAIDRGRFAASAKNSSSTAPSDLLGSDFTELEDAQEACRAYQRKHRQ